MKKEIKSRKEYYIDFTDDECDSLNIKDGDKFSLESTSDGFVMKKYSTIEIDLAEFSREVLEFLISESIEKEKSVSEVIEEILESVLKDYQNGND